MYKKIGLLIAGLTTAINLYANEPLKFKLNKQIIQSQQVSSEVVTEKSWGNRFLLIAVGYTGCPDICPTTMLDMREALKTLDSVAPNKVKKLQPLFVTIDPESDTLADITRYAAYFDKRIIGLRAENFDDLDYLVSQLRASYGYEFEGKPVYPPNLPKGYTVSHSIFIYLYSPSGELLDVFPYNMAGKELAKRILTYLP